MSRYDNLAEVLARRAADAGSSEGFHFREDDGTTVSFLSFAEIDLRARSVARVLEDAGATGERVLLVYPQGLDYVVALFGCFYAGAVAVPIYPPDPSRLSRTLPRFLDVVANARPRCLATSAAIASLLEASASLSPALAALPRIATDVLEIDAKASPRAHPRRQDLAFLQYTSGSTSSPKGVMVSYDNLLTNLEVIRLRLGLDRDTHMVSWLPFYHDLGLVGGLFGPLYSGGTGTYLSPFAFLSRPRSWMLALSETRATITGAPNFAFALCARKIDDETLGRLDLSNLKTLYCGAEPIRKETLERFADRFAPAGLSRAALAPCYGLAESTLLVTFERLLHGPVYLDVDKGKLSEGIVAPPQGDDVTSLVACGPVGDFHEVAIVDPEQRVPAAADRVGEIWVSGPSVSLGYFGQPRESEEALGARLDGSDRRWLRTGDLGFFAGERLFVTGRIKDLIFVRGRNLYPQDLEATAEESHPAVRPGCSAAFPVNFGEEERVVLVAEADPSRAALDEVVTAIQRAVVESHEITPHAVVLIRPRSVEKTSSGKIRRRAIQAAYLAGTLDELARGVFHSADPTAGRTAIVDETARAWAADPSTAAEVLESRIRESVALRLGLAASDVSPDRGLLELGLDSLAIAELAAELEIWIGRPIASSTLFDHATPRRLATHLAQGPASDDESRELDDLLDDLETMSGADVAGALSRKQSGPG